MKLIKDYTPDYCHNNEYDNISPLLSFDDSRDFAEYKKAVHERLFNLLGMGEFRKVEPNIEIEFKKDFDSFREIRFTFDTEKYCRAICHLWIPKLGKEKYGVVICLQGHSTGMHISMGRPLYEGDEETMNGGDRDFAVQIIKEGYAALIIEQRAFGERKSPLLDHKNNTSTTCLHASMIALMLGRTLLGERVWDISRAIDVLSAFPEIDTEKIACMGNSGGGTATFYAACMDERIKLVMPSCAVCTYRDSIVAMRHCACNYIPKVAKYFDMGDLSCLIAPRPFIIVAGKEDPIFPKHGVEKTFETVKKIYEKAGAPENCRLIFGEEGHRFYANPSWDVLRSFNIL